MATEHDKSDTSGTVAFDCPRPLIEAADKAAETELLSRSSWLRRLIAQATGARVTPTESRIEA
jgi:hypothetical protein